MEREGKGREGEGETPVRSYAVVRKQDCGSWSRTVSMERDRQKRDQWAGETGRIYEALRVLSTVQGVSSQSLHEPSEGREEDLLSPGCKEEGTQGR